MSNEDLVDIVDEECHIIGRAGRQEAHEKGLLHREVHVWLFTPLGKLVLQHRSPAKINYPDLLDASVGGHIDAGMGWADTALKELEEESGMRGQKSDLVSIGQLREHRYDPHTQMTNNAILRVYALPFHGNLSVLRPQKREVTHFELWSISELSNLSNDAVQRFVPGLLDEEIPMVIERLENPLASS